MDEKTTEDEVFDDAQLREIEEPSEPILSDAPVETQVQEQTLNQQPPKEIPAKVPRGHKLKQFLRTKKGKVIAIVSVLVLVIAVLLSVPTTRYAIVGSLLKKVVTVTVIDSETKKPVSDASVKIDQYSGKTDNNGKALLSSVPVGKYTLTIDKKYYKSASQSYTVPILSKPTAANISLEATGRQVTVVVTNSISGALLANANVKLSDTSAVTDEKGEATIVLPISATLQKGTVTHDGFNATDIAIKVENKADQKVEAKLTPSGTIYYLSKRTGKINVMKSSLDGTNAQVVVEGTGSENDNTTSLLASRDWKYLALLAQRTGDKPKLYLVNTATGQLTVMDEGNATFNLVGWSDSKFIFTVSRQTTNFWDDKGQALKSYDAAAGKITTLDETTGSGTNMYDYAYESIQGTYLLKDEIVYTKTWYQGSSNMPSDKKMAIMSVKPDGQSKTRVKEFATNQNSYIDSRLYKPQAIYFRVTDTSAKPTFYAYSNKKIVATADTNEDKFYNGFYPTYLISPSGDRTFWYEQRDGKNVLIVGDSDGLNSKEIAVSSDFVPYGWYGDEYVLMSKKGSELYISARDTVLSETSTPLKVTDYHKPFLTYPGYGYGYGGQ